MSNATNFAVIQSGDGYSGTATGPLLDDASEFLATETRDLPEISAGQVLIRVKQSIVNPSDIHFVKGEYGQPRIKGMPAGFEGVGEVVETGAGAEKLKGQRVAFIASVSGAWAQYAATDAINCIPLHPAVSDDDGAAQIVNPLTAMGMVQLAKSHSDGVIITAATSQLGKLMTALAKDMGLAVVATCRRADAVEDLKARGADAVLVTTDADFEKQAAAALAGHKPRMMLDALGDEVAATLFDLMPTRGRWVSYGKLSTNPPAIKNIGQLIFMMKQIEGFWLTRWMKETAPADLMKAVQEVQARFADGRWKTDVAHRLTLEDAVSGLGPALNSGGGKIMIDCS